MVKKLSRVNKINPEFGIQESDKMEQTKTEKKKNKKKREGSKSRPMLSQPMPLRRWKKYKALVKSYLNMLIQVYVFLV